MNEECLVTAYKILGVPVDRVAVSSELRTAFRELLPAQMRDVTEDELMKRLLNLRKSGKLPRLFRGV
jgi:hypothetical protein